MRGIHSLFVTLRDQRSLVTTLLAFVGLAFIHVYIKSNGPQYAGVLLAVDHLFDIAITLVCLALSVGMGLLLLATAGIRSLSALEEFVIAAGLGSGIIGTSTLLLGATFGFSRVTLSLLLAMCFVVSRKPILSLVKLVRLAWSDVATHTGLFPLTIMAIVAAFMVSQALLPPTNWDTLMYHLQLPAQLLQLGSMFLPEDNLHIAYLQLVHMLYLPLLAYGSPAGPALLSVFFALVLGLAVFALALRFFDNRTAAFSIPLLWSSTILLVVAITPRIDVTLALFLFLAHFALLLATIDWKLFYLAAAALGFAVGIKYTAAVYALSLVPVIVWVSFKKKSNFFAATLDLVHFSIISLAVSLPWYAKNWWLFGAPFYPIFAQRQVDPWLAFAYPEKVLPSSINPDALSMLGAVRQPFNLIDLYLDPKILSIELEAVFYRFSPLFLILILWAISFTRNKILTALIVPSILYILLLIAFSSRTNLRYLIPVAAPLTLASVYMLLIRVIRGRDSTATHITCCVLVVLLLLPTANVIRIWSANKISLNYLIGKSSYEDYLYHTTFPPDYAVFTTTVAYINEKLPPTSRVLMLFDARGFNLKVSVIQDNVLTNWPLLAHRASKLNCLAGTGITHVLVNVGSVNYYLQRGLAPETIQWNIFQQFADKCLVRVFEGPSHVLYQVQ